MPPTLIIGAILAGFAIIGLIGFRRLPEPARIAFDLVCFIAISAFLFHENVSPIFSRPIGPLRGGELWLHVIGGVWWLLGARLAVVAFRFWLGHDRRSRQARLVSELVAAAIYIATTLIVVSSVLALPVGGLLATSGVFAIVLGLALQNTLADVFAGIAVGVERPFGAGDRISLDDNIEGEVVQINWRSIRLQTDGDDVAIIPNSLVAKSRIVNRSFPTQRRASTVELPCEKHLSPELVIELFSHAILLCPSILVAPPPSVELTRIGLHRNTYKISFFVEDTKKLSKTRDMLLRQCLRLLHYHALVVGPQSHTKVESGKAPAAAFALLRELALFECLDDEQIERLSPYLEQLLLEPDETLFAQGASDAMLHVISAGVVELTRAGDTTPMETVGRIGPGDFLGEIGLLTGSPHLVTATALTHCQAYRLSHDALAPLLSDNPELVSAFERSVRRVTAMLHRKVATSAAEAIAGRSQLIARIRSFFHFPPVVSR